MNQTMLDRAPNFRDLGGYETVNGGVVLSGLVYRSGHLAQLTDADLATLEHLDIRTVVDFRSSVELELSGTDRLPGTANYFPIPIGDPAMAPQVRLALREGDFTALPNLAWGNRMLIRDFGSQFGRLLRLVADPNMLPLVFHCIGGKDRSGIAAALLLSLLGVPWDSVRDDYLESNGRLAGTVEDQDAFLAKLSGEQSEYVITEESRAAWRRFFILEAEYIEAAWDEIGLVAGSFDRYVTERLGLSDDEIAAIRANLVTSPT